MKEGTEVIEGEIVEEKSLAAWTPRFIRTVDQAVHDHDERIDYLKRVLKENVHYGVIPGTGSKPALLKPGAEALMADMGLRPDGVDERPPVLDFDGRDHNGEAFIHYQRKMNLYRLHPTTGDRIWVGSGSGSCNSWEDKYRWRTSVRICPTCKVAAIIKGKEEYGGGWVCFKKKGGCGAKFKVDDKAITEQPIGRVANDRVADLANTILKMADKRATVAAVLNTTGVSDLFTQDIDDGDAMDDAERDRMEASREQGAPPAATSTANRKPSGQAGLDTARAQAAAAKVPWTDEQRDKLRARVKVLQAEKHPVLYHGWKDFMVSLGQESWKILYSDQALLPQAYELLGIAILQSEQVKQPEFDPTGAPA